MGTRFTRTARRSVFTVQLEIGDVELPEQEQGQDMAAIRPLQRHRPWGTP